MEKHKWKAKCHLGILQVIASLYGKKLLLLMFSTFYSFSRTLRHAYKREGQLKWNRRHRHYVVCRQLMEAIETARI